MEKEVTNILQLKQSFLLSDFPFEIFTQGPWQQIFHMKVKCDHRSKFSNLSNWKEEAYKLQIFHILPCFSHMIRNL